MCKTGSMYCTCTSFVASIDEPGVVSDRPSQVAHAHQDHVPHAIDLENPSQLIGQIPDVVAGALLPEFTELRQVLANLRRGNPKTLAQFLGGGNLLTVGGHVTERAEVKRESAHDDIRHAGCGHRFLQPENRAGTLSQVERGAN